MQTILAQRQPGQNTTSIGIPVKDGFILFW